MFRSIVVASLFLSLIHVNEYIDYARTFVQDSLKYSCWQRKRQTKGFQRPNPARPDCCAAGHRKRPSGCGAITRTGKTQSEWIRGHADGCGLKLDACEPRTRNRDCRNRGLPINLRTRTDRTYVLIGSQPIYKIGSVWNPLPDEHNSKTDAWLPCEKRAWLEFVALALITIGYWVINQKIPIIARIVAPSGLRQKWIERPDHTRTYQIVPGFDELASSAGKI